MSISSAAQETHRLVTSYNIIKGKKLEDTHFASGVIVKLSNLDGTDITDSFVIHGEFFGPVRETLIEGLEQTLIRRREFLEGQLKNVDKSLSNK